MEGILPVIDDTKDRMENALDAVRRDFDDGAHGQGDVPSILDTVRVSAYGSLMPLNQVATVSAPGSRRSW